MLSVAEDHLRDAEPGRAARGLRPGAERRDLRDLPLRHDAEGPGRLAHRARQHVHRGRPRGRARSTTCSPTRRSAWSGRRSSDAVEDEARDARLRRPLRRRAAARSTTARFLFLQHMISKMKPAEEGGSRLAIVFNGSPLFTGAAGSGESEIRRWIIENDWLEAIVALPDQLFYNTGISTYFWVVTNRKTPGAARQGAARRCPRAVREDAQEPRREAQGDQRRADRRDHPPLRRLRGERAGQDLPQRAVRLPADHRRAAAAAALGGRRRDAARAARGVEGVRQARRRAARGAARASSARSTGSSTTDRAKALAPSQRRRQLSKAEREGAARRARRARPRGAGHHDEGRARARPGAARQRERAAAADEPVALRGRPDRAARERAVPRAPSTST